MHSPLLIVEDYDHYKVMMERILLGKEKCEEKWRSVKEGPHVPVRKMVRDVAATPMG